MIRILLSAWWVILLQGMRLVLVSRFRLALWMLLAAYGLVRKGWLVKASGGLGWVMLLAGLAAAVVAAMTVTPIGMGAIGVATVVGVQVMMAGIGMIALAIVKKTVLGHIRERLKVRVEEMRSARCSSTVFATRYFIIETNPIIS